MHTSPTSAHVCGQGPRSDRLHDLVVRIAAGDRPAFRTLYAFLAIRVWDHAARLLRPGDARAVTRSTFVEVWHLAGDHLGHEPDAIRAWIPAITTRHVDDRVRSVGGLSAHRDSYDWHTLCELTVLLGTGQATVRTGPATFARVVGLVT